MNDRYYMLLSKKEKLKILLRELREANDAVNYRKARQEYRETCDEISQIENSLVFILRKMLKR